MRFRTALLWSTVALVAGSLAVTVGAILAVAGRSARAQLTSDLARSRAAFETVHAERQVLMRSEARVMAEEPRLKAVVATEEVSDQTVLGVALDLRKALQSDLFIITDPEGAVRADTADPTATGKGLGGNAQIAQAFSQGDSAGVWIDGARLYQVQARRLAFGATTVGALAIGYQVDDRWAERIQRHTASAAVVEVDGRVIAASPLEGGPVPDRQVLAAALKAVVTAAEQPAEVSSAGQIHLAVAGPFPGYGGQAQVRYVLLRSLDAALEPSRRLARIVLVILLVAIAAAAAIAAALSSRLSRPLDALAAFAGEIGAGQLDLRVELAGPREVRALGQAMNRMVEEVDRSRRELAETQRLKKEMEIAVQLQTALLPRRLNIEGLDIAAQMIPASEVGGDYYDVIPAPGGAWLAIGDVAGHGLTAGIVMSMVQVVVLSLTRAQPDAAPRDLTVTANKLLYENIRERLARDEHVTFSLLRYFRDGRVVFAGAHEEILVCRATGGRCELIPTPGTWLGAMWDIGPFTRNSELRLRDGDLFVLYTDGILEAMAPGGEQFGVERFCAEIEARRTEPVERIRDAVFEALRRFWREQGDDVTLLIIRYRGVESTLAPVPGQA